MPAPIIAMRAPAAAQCWQGEWGHRGRATAALRSKPLLAQRRHAQPRFLALKVQHR